MNDNQIVTHEQAWANFQRWKVEYEIWLSRRETMWARTIVVSWILLIIVWGTIIFG